MMSASLRVRLVEDQQRRRESERWRQRSIVQSAQRPRVMVDGREMINFSSNDYLGLADHPRLKAVAAEAIQTWGTGSGASHLVCGHQAPHHALEQSLARFVGAERALLFSSGYLANLAVGTAFADRQDLVLQDKLNHASLIDAALSGKARFRRYAHSDVRHAQSILEHTKFRSSVIITDGVFSMDGDVAELAALKHLADETDGLLIVDEAHGFGVLGETGAGALEACGLAPVNNVLMMGTLGKAFGGFGAFVAGDAVFIEQLIQTARSYIYTTALPAASATTMLEAVTLIKHEGQKRRCSLNSLVSKFKAGISQLGLALMPSETPIQPMVVGTEAAALSMSRALAHAGFMVKAIRPPTVPEGTSRLRFTFSAAHTERQIEALLQAIESTQAVA